MCDGVAAYRTSLCQSPAIWSRIRAISSSGTTTNTSDKSKPRQFVGLIYKLTKFATRACRPMSKQPSQNSDKLTNRSANGRAKRRPAQIDHLPSATRHKRVIGHYVLPCGAGYCLWTRGFSGRRCPRAGHRAHVRVRETRCEMAGPDMASGPAGAAAWPCRPGGPVV